MSLPIISADERLAEKRDVKGVLVGKSGIGKTSQLWTLPQDSTLFFDLEAGDLAVEDWPGDSLRPRTWSECRDFAVFITGPNPGIPDDQSFSQAHFHAVCARFGDPGVLEKYNTLFVDSITVAGRLCLQWCRGQPQAYSEKTGKPDMRNAYGLLGQEMIGWLGHLQHARGKNVWFVGILDERVDDKDKRTYSLQIEGAKTGFELPGIADEVITFAELKANDGTEFRAFVCQTLNPWGYPAKDRSGRLEIMEEPHLGRLMAKISGPVKPALERLQFAPPPAPTEPTQEEAPA